MASPKNRLPECGLYRTTEALPGHEERIPAGTIVYFHNHSESGGPLPTVVPPDHNIHNRWHFHGPSIEFRGLSWAETLESVPAQGYYTLRKDLPFEGGSWPKGTIVQLGYTMKADPILFIARIRAGVNENSLHFSDKGLGIKREQFALLEPASIYTEPGGQHADQQH
jgi:hypothetical protein